jgi:hypothetical protein
MSSVMNSPQSEHLRRSALSVPSRVRFTPKMHLQQAIGISGLANSGHLFASQSGCHGMHPVLNREQCLKSRDGYMAKRRAS